jgi:hypothetical protein
VHIKNQFYYQIQMEINNNNIYYGKDKMMNH